MALPHLTSLAATTFSRLPPTNYRISIASFSKNIVFPSGVQCKASIKMCDETIVRRSANYQPSIWSFDYVQSLKSEYVGESWAQRVTKLKKDVRLMLDTMVDPLHQLELVDDLQRLGISYHFEDEKRNFKSCLKNDCKGILSLYEAAFLLKEGENAIFHDIRSLTTSYLKAYVKDNKDQYLSTLVSHALELPLNWRMLRLEARWFIDVYERRPDMNNAVLELAKLDFDMWADICKSYLLEAKWYHSGYIPTLAEYIENAWVSISGPVILVHAYFFITNPITKEALECLEEYNNIIRWSSMIFRLADDLETSSVSNTTISN
ncbi:hypothetical protein Patl1_10185 [Pistacia atlantica]|uniref:Uncharacterized protein n=1 Tax=Pistacia atlantica TaxID=434234 RepID=A0ACC1A269_9ROSI|nr:hypothetical protein Patl1_10185 [Pistacia atlantica]